MNKTINKEKLKTYIQITRITIVICWISLFAFWAIKLFGGNWFEIVVKNDNFIKFSQKVETTWLKYLVSFITIAVAKYLTFGAICQEFRFKGKQRVIVWACIISIWAGVNFLNSDFIKMWYAYIVMVAIGFIYQKGWKKLFGVLGAIFDCSFSIISATIRNLPIEVFSNYLLTFVLIVDMFIMTALYYLYSNLNKLKKEIK